MAVSLWIQLKTIATCPKMKIYLSLAVAIYTLALPFTDKIELTRVHAMMLMHFSKESMRNSGKL
jgi:hypothetical protein